MVGANGQCLAASIDTCIRTYVRDNLRLHGCIAGLQMGLDDVRAKYKQHDFDPAFRRGFEFGVHCRDRDERHL
jgi:hypothetical protein